MRMLSFLNDPVLISLFNLFIFIILCICIHIYNFLYPQKKINLFLILILISIIPVLSIFRPGTFEAGDMRAHTAHLIDFYYNLREGNFVPRWSDNLCAGYGCPIFIIEYTLPYYLGSLFQLIGFSALNSIKLVLATSFIASGITMYYWAKDSFGKIPGFVGALLYLFAPYHLITMHYRGSVGEILAFVFIPLLFYFTKNLILSFSPLYFILMPLTILALILSHSSTTIAVLPISIGYAFVIWYFSKKRKINSMLFYIISIIIGVLISAFYWLPALMQVNYTWWGQLNGVSFRPFVDFIFSPYHYGFLFQGKDGNYIPLFGYIHIFLFILSILLLLKNSIPSSSKKVLIYFISSSFFLILMMNSMTKSIWGNIPVLSSFLYAHRLLVPLAFLTAGIGAIAVVNIKNKKIISSICFLIIIITVLNWANRKMVPKLDDPFRTSDTVYTEYFDKSKNIYIERSNLRSNNLQVIYNSPRDNTLEFITGNGEIIDLKRDQTSRSYLVQVDDNAKLKENTFYFPGWKVYINDKQIPINFESPKNEDFGKITFSLIKGEYLVNIVYENTPIEKFSKAVSIFAILLLVFCTFLKLKKKNNTIDKIKK